jgi:hypothetical protein
MADAWVKKRVLITVRTYPVPATKSIEASCTAGITSDGQWIRLFPIPYRLMDQERRFVKWQWIDVNVIKAANDPRPESYKLNVDSIQVGEVIGTQDEWRARRQIIEPLRGLSMCRIQGQQKQHGYPTLGIFRPHQIKRLIIESTDANWSQGELNTLRQSTLFDKAPAQILEKIPFDFRYEFRCGDVDCRGHTMICTDWEMGQAYRSWRREYGDQWEAKFRQRFETEMIEKNETQFFVGTIHQYPNSWIIVGLFYPPKQQMDDLFAGTA